MLINRIVRSLRHSKVLTFYGGRYNCSENKKVLDSIFSAAAKEEMKKNSPFSYIDLSNNRQSLASVSEEELKSHFGFFSLDAKEEIKRSLNVQEGEEVHVIQEGRAKIFHKEYTVNKNNTDEQKQSVFYNPVQIFNRDLSVLVVQSYLEWIREKHADTFQPAKILDALAATGLRTIRFIKEIDPSLIDFIHACDLDEGAIALMKKNFEWNNVDPAKAEAIKDDANVLMFKRSHGRDMNTDPNDPLFKYNVIDLDPYGSALPFLDTAIQAIKNGGLLAATFTDMRVLAGRDYAKCFSYYGVSRVQVPCYSEFQNSLRILLNVINTTANRYGKYIIPVLSVQSDFYARLFVTVHSSRQECQKSFLKTGFAYICTECNNYHIHQAGKLEGNTCVANKIESDIGKCSECNSPMTLNGPIWTGPLNDIEFVTRLVDKIQGPELDLKLGSKKKIHGLLHSILQEKETADFPLSISMDALSKFFKLKIPSQTLLSTAATQHGFSIVPSYAYPALYKTNAPLKLYYDLFRHLRKTETQASKEDINKNLEPAARFAISQPPQYNFELDKVVKLDPIKVPRFFPNPQKNWGPLKRAESKSSAESSKPKSQ